MLDRRSGEQDRVDQNGHQNDRPAPVVRDAVVEPVQDAEQRFGDEACPAPVDNLLEFFIDGPQEVGVFGSHVEFEVQRSTAAQTRAHLRFFFIRGVGNVVGVGGQFQRSAAGRQPTPAKYLSSSPRKRSCRWPRLDRRWRRPLSFLQAGIGGVVIERPSFRRGIGAGEVSESAAPNQECGNITPFSMTWEVTLTR